MTGWDQRLGVWWIAEDHADLPAALASPSGVTLTFGELAGRAHQIVHAIRARGLRAGDVVADALPNGVDVIWWQLALQESGMRGISLNPSLSAREFLAIVDDAGADCIVRLRRPRRRRRLFMSPLRCDVIRTMAKYVPGSV